MFWPIQPGTSEYRRIYNLHRIYGLTPSRVDELIAAQEGCCGICGYSLGMERNIDHDHRTGVIRGIVHSQCNLAIGLFNENPEALIHAVDYLRRFGDKQLKAEVA